MDGREQFRRPALQFEARVLMRLVAGERGNALHEIKDGRMTFLVEHGRDDLLGVALRETTLPKEGLVIIIVAGDDLGSCPLYPGEEGFKLLG